MAESQIFNSFKPQTNNFLKDSLDLNINSNTYLGGIAKVVEKS